MSDQYSIRVDELTQGTLEEMLADGAEHQMQEQALKRVLLHGGEDEHYCALTLTVKEDHPDAWPLSERTAGLILFILSDTSAAIQEALGGFDHINSNKFSPDQTTSPVAYRVVEVSEEAPRTMKLRVWCAARYAPNPDDRYSSAAWAVDDFAFKTARWHFEFGDRFPAPGLAGNFGPYLVIDIPIPAGQYYQDFAAVGSDAVAVLTTPAGGRLISRAPFETMELLDATPLRGKTTSYQRLLYSEGKLYAETRPPKGGPGKFSSFDPATGALIDKNAKEPEGPLAQWSEEPVVVGDAQFAVEDGQLIATAADSGQELWRETVVPSDDYTPALMLSPQKDTLMIAHRSRTYFFHVPTKSVALSYKTDGREPVGFSADGRHMFFPVRIGGAKLAVRSMLE